ncbi:MAG: proline racemase family protein [Chlamydiota bacterium]
MFSVHANLSLPNSSTLLKRKSQPSRFFNVFNTVNCQFFKKKTEVIDFHVRGKTARLVLDGLLPLAGITMLERTKNAKIIWNFFHQKIFCDTQKHQCMFGIFLTPSKFSTHSKEVPEAMVKYFFSPFNILSKSPCLKLKGLQPPFLKASNSKEIGFTKQEMKKINVIDVHVGGEPARLVLEGLPPLPGNTMLERWENAKILWDPFRQKILCEPRGHLDMFGVFLTPPITPQSHYGAIFCDASGFLSMCGHGSMCLAYALVKLGKIKKTVPETEVKLDTPAGPITLNVEISKSLEIQRVKLFGIPSFVYKQNLIATVDSKAITYNIAFGGNFFAFIDIAQLGLQVTPQHLPELIILAQKIMEIIKREIRVVHPDNPSICGVKLITFTEMLGVRHTRNVTIWGKGQFDRSPCGTGTSAEMALFTEKGILNIGEEFISESIIGSIFVGCICKKIENSSSSVTYYQPSICSQPHLMAMSTLFFEPSDNIKVIGFDRFNVLEKPPNKSTL